MATSQQKPIQLLIVSANQLVRAGIRIILGTHHNFAVIKEVSVASALDVAAQEQPDVILRDVEMPGLAIEEFLRARPHQPHITGSEGFSISVGRIRMGNIRYS